MSYEVLINNTRENYLEPDRVLLTTESEFDLATDLYDSGNGWMTFDEAVEWLKALPKNKTRNAERRPGTVTGTPQQKPSRRLIRES